MDSNNLDKADALKTKASVARIRFQIVPVSNRSTLDCAFKCLRFHDRFHRFRVNRR